MQRHIIRSTSRNSPFARALLLGTMLASGLAAPAMAQTGPELFRANDEHGVDLATGTYNLEFTQGSIGPAEGRVAVKYYIGRGGAQDNWSGLLYRTLEASTPVAEIIFGSISERFTKQGGVWVSAKANGATLVETQSDLAYTFKTPDGRTIYYQSPLIVGGASASFNPTVFACGSESCALPTGTLEPNGSQYSLTWHVPEQCSYDEELNATCNRTFRLADIRSNSGYAVKIKYQSNQNFTGSPQNQGPPPTTWFKRSGLKFFDLSQVFCDPGALNCDSVAGTWPTVTYANPAVGVTEITNSQNGTWRIESTGTQYKIRRAGAAVDTTVVNIAGDGKVSSITDNGETKSYVWGTSSGGNPQVTTTDGVGATNTVTIPPVTITPRPVSEVDGLGQATAYAYDGNNRLTRETRPEGDYTNYTYDARGNITETRAVAKSGSGLADMVSTANYDASCTNAAKCNKPNYTVDSMGTQTDFTYDATHGELIKVQLAAATTGGIRAEVNYVYSMLSAQIKDAGGTLVAQPAQAKLTQITTCATAATCAATVNETKITIAYATPNLLPTSVATATGTGSVTSTVAYTYDANDNLATIDGPLSGTTDTVTYFYDAQNRRRGVIGADPDGASARPRAAERYTFNSESQVTKVETGTATTATVAALDAMTVAQTVDIVFDANGKKIKETVSGTAGATQVVQLTYDADQRLQCTALRMNPAIFASLPSSACSAGAAGTGGNDFGADRITQNTYDANGRVTLVQTAVGTLEQANEVATGYSANGATAYVVDAENNRTAYVYDGFNRLRQTQFPSATKGANVGNPADYEELGYDASSNVISRRLRDAQVVGYGYDKLNRLTSKNLPGTEPDATYTYDLLSRAKTAVQSGQTLTFNYDALGRNTSQVGPRGTVGFQYDVAGRRTRITYPGTTSLYVQYVYDVTGNVLELRENGLTTAVGKLAIYAYDNLGRRASTTFGNGVVQSYSFDTSQRLSTIASNLGGTVQDQSASFTYNPAGQIDSLTKSNDAYAWAGHYNIDRLYGSNGLNQLTSAGANAIGYDSKGNLTSSGSNIYTYSSENFLKTGPASATFVYDPLGRLYESVGAGVTTRFLYDSTDMIAEYNSTNALQRRYVHGPGTDEPVLWYEGSVLTDKRYLTADERGSITAITNASGAAIQLNAYDEYGIPAATNLGRFQYTGQTWLPEIGMYYYKARIYSPTLGRFMQTDPIGYADGMNWYNYVGSDPVNSTDPFGLWEVCEIKDTSHQNKKGEIVVSSELICKENGLTLGGLNSLDDWWKNNIGNEGNELQASLINGNLIAVAPDLVITCQTADGPVDTQQTSRNAFQGGDPAHLHNPAEGGAKRESSPGPDDGAAAKGTGKAVVGTSKGLYIVERTQSGYAIGLLAGKWGSKDRIESRLKAWNKYDGKSGAKYVKDSSKNCTTKKP